MAAGKSPPADGLCKCRHGVLVNRGVKSIMASMRFYTLPTEEGKTACVNFDHVTNILVGPKSIELYVVGIQAPMIIPKSPATLSVIAKGMDLSDNSRDQINSL
jgi:hypothetical protein